MLGFVLCCTVATATSRVESLDFVGLVLRWLACVLRWLASCVDSLVMWVLCCAGLPVAATSCVGPLDVGFVLFMDVLPSVCCLFLLSGR